MPYNREVHHRHSVRLPQWDYSASGFYFVTICSHEKECLFGEIIDGKMILNNFGKIIKDEWLKSEKIRKEISFDEWIIMPNHIHGIVIIDNHHSVGANGRSPLPRDEFQPRQHMESKSLSSFMAGFKSSVTSKINQLRNTPGIPLWQRNYHEHIIRNDHDLQRIREYIQNNPLKWDEDQNNPNLLS